jgi:hypothetical protein
MRRWLHSPRSLDTTRNRLVACVTRHGSPCVAHRLHRHGR